MINWPELATRAAAGPWSQEEFFTLFRLTEVGPLAADLTELVELIKSARSPDSGEKDREFIPDMSFAFWGDVPGSLLDWSQRRRFTDLTLKTATELAAAAGVTEEEISSVYPACLAFRLVKPQMLFDV